MVCLLINYGLLLIFCYCRFDIRLRGYLSQRQASLATLDNTDIFKKTRLLKYVPLQGVTTILGPFGDGKFLISSEGFHSADKIFVVSYEEV